MKKILVLGAGGMLGNAVAQYFTQEGYEVETILARWPENTFKEALRQMKPDAIVNAIGKIPQKEPSAEAYRSVNIDLPTFLETLDIPVLHPSTDSEFSGQLPLGESYTRDSERDATSPYGMSKAEISARIESSFSNTKLVRTSIIGHELSTHNSLLDWFLHAEGSVRGYTNHYWNGITTLEWAKQAKTILEHWNEAPILTQLASPSSMSKYEVLLIAKEIYEKDVEIVPFATSDTVNKCLASDLLLPGFEDQLAELRDFTRTR